MLYTYDAHNSCVAMIFKQDGQLNVVPIISISARICRPSDENGTVQFYGENYFGSLLVATMRKMEYQ